MCVYDPALYPPLSWRAFLWQGLLAAAQIEAGDFAQCAQQAQFTVWGGARQNNNMQNISRESRSNVVLREYSC